MGKKEYEIVMTRKQALFVKDLRIIQNMSDSSVAIIYSRKFDGFENPDFQYGKELIAQVKTFFESEGLDWNTVNLTN